MHLKSTPLNVLIGGVLLLAGLVGGFLLAQNSNRPAHGQEKSTQQKKDGDKGHDHDHEPATVGSAKDRGKLVPGKQAVGSAPVPVHAPDLPRLPWKMVDGAKEFHLTAEHVKREFLPEKFFDVWGFNGSMPGPTIEAVEGDQVRIIVHNKLPESTIIHWHGLEVPNRFDGVHGMIQDPIKPGESYTYEFTLHQNGTFFYHSHGPMQEAMGMVGLFIIYPKVAHSPPVDRDFALIMQEFAILPQNTIPNTMSMEFNFFTINGRSGPYTTPLVVKQGERVRIRFLNFSTIDAHPMHLHGHTFWVTGTEGGRIPESAWVPGNNVLVGTAQVREVEFIANNPGDWMIHCHMFHHMMNHMTSMVGPMGGHSMKGTGTGKDMNNGLGMLSFGKSGKALEDAGPSVGRGMGEQTGSDRAVKNGEQHDHKHGDAEATKKVPGYPQDMMDMHGMMSEAEMKKLQKLETRGMRNGWYAGVEALMTVIRVLPPELYDRVMSGKGDVPPGSSVPGGTPGKMPGHEHHHDGKK
jgi:FtsP/CotA-like multicopper oxidase with cupredoxin domain